MTKTYTEQWRDGTLRGCFYWKLPNGNICMAYTDTMKDMKKVRDSDEVEVLQEAPSYYEWKRLQEQLHEKGLWIGVLKSHLEECWEIIKMYAEHDYLTPEDFYMRDRLEMYYRKAGLGNIEDAKKILEKWGVK